jgi:hypothetical protein
MIMLGEILCAVESSLLISIRVSTPTVLCATYMLLAGLDDELSTNRQYIAYLEVASSLHNVYRLRRKQTRLLAQSEASLCLQGDVI